MIDGGQADIVSVTVRITCLHLQKWLFQYHLHVNVFYFETSESQITPCRLLFAIKLLMLLIKLSINFCWLFRVMVPQMKKFHNKPYLLKDELEINLEYVKLVIYFTPISFLMPYKIFSESICKASALISGIIFILKFVFQNYGLTLPFLTACFFRH